MGDWAEGWKECRGARTGRTGSGDRSTRMAAAAMTAAGCGAAGAARSLSRFRGCLAGALLGDCVGAIYEANDTVNLTSVLRHVQSLEPEPGSPGSARTGGRGRARGPETAGLARLGGRVPRWGSEPPTGQTCVTRGHSAPGRPQSDLHLLLSGP